MSSLSDLLDADWDQLNALIGLKSNKRQLMHHFSARFAPVVLIRSAQYLYGIGWRRLSKIPALANVLLFGIEVPPRLPIGPGLVIMHTYGTVLGANSIGSRVTIYHQVTLGAADIDFSYTMSKRPVIEDGVVLCVGAKVLGGITIGANSIVGANAVVLRSVPPKHTAVGVPARNHMTSIDT